MGLSRHQETILRSLEDPALLAQAVISLTPIINSLKAHETLSYVTKVAIPEQAVSFALGQKSSSGSAYFLFRNCDSLALLKERVKKERRGPVLAAFALNPLCDLDLALAAFSRSPAGYNGNELRNACDRRIRKIFQELRLEDIKPALEKIRSDQVAFATFALSAAESVFKREDIDFDFIIDLTLSAPPIRGIQTPLFKRPEIIDPTQRSKVEKFLLDAQSSFDWTYFHSEVVVIIADLPFIFKPEFKELRSKILSRADSTAFSVLLKNKNCPPNFGQDLVLISSSWLVEALAASKALPPTAFEDVKIGSHPLALAYYLEYRLKDNPQSIGTALMLLDSFQSSNTLKEVAEAVLYL